MVKRFAVVVVGDVTRTVDLLNGGPPPAPPALASVAGPTITGALLVGQTVSASVGTWSAPPDSYSYQWRRGGVPIGGATAATYLLVEADVGTGTVTVTVTAHKGGWVSGSATSAAVTVAPQAEPDEHNFFAWPAAAAASPRLWFGHWFPVFPIAITNPTNYNGTNDWWTTGYNRIGGDGGNWTTKGGYTRDRPDDTNMPYPGNTGVEHNETSRRNMYADEIALAKRYRLDGFMCDILGAGAANQNWIRTLSLLNACVTQHPDFKLVPQLDADGSAAAAGYVSVAGFLNTFLNFACSYRLPNGNYVIGSYRPESQNTTFWNNLRTQMLNVHGKTVEFWHVAHSGTTGIQYASTGQTAFGIWGNGADPNIQTNQSTTWVTQTKGRGEKVIFSVWAQDIRQTGDPKFDESRNTGALRAAWAKARQVDADLVMLATWSDYGEQSHFLPSVMRGSALMMISSYEAARWKTGQAPPILRDAVVVSHRTNIGDSAGGVSSGTTFTGGQSVFMTHWDRPNRSTFRQHVEILTYLTAPDTVTVNIGPSNEYTYEAPAGEYVQTYPMSYGQVRVRTGRGEDLTSPFNIAAVLLKQDRQYVLCDNIRGTTGQRNVANVS